MYICLFFSKEIAILNLNILDLQVSCVPRSTGLLKLNNSTQLFSALNHKLQVLKFQKCLCRRNHWEKEWLSNSIPKMTSNYLNLKLKKYEASLKKKKKRLVDLTYNNFACCMQTTGGLLIKFCKILLVVSKKYIRFLKNAIRTSARKWNILIWKILAITKQLFIFFIFFLF